MVAVKRADSVVKKIFASDKRIHFCAVVGADGRIEAGGMRPGIRSLEPAVETARIVTRMFLSQAMNQAADQYLGRANWAIVRREGLVQITFPLPEGKQVQVTASLDYPISKVDKLNGLVNPAQRRVALPTSG
jgi:hypothetical protein